MKAGGELLRRAFNSDAWVAYIGDDVINPDDLDIGPNSIDVSLHKDILLPDSNKPLDLRRPETCHYAKHTMTNEGWIVYPHSFILAATRERFDCRSPLTLAFTNVGSANLKDVFFTQEVHGRSTIGRCGLCIHATAGYGDYGFQGSFTLELFNVTNRPITIYPEIKVAQVEFSAVYQPTQYKGAYAGKGHYYGPIAPSLGGRF